MSANAKDFFRLIGFVQDDLRTTQARLVELRSMVAAMNFPEASAHVCPECGLDRGTEDRLRDHLANVHAIDVCDGEKKARQASDSRARTCARPGTELTRRFQRPASAAVERVLARPPTSPGGANG